MNTPFTFVGPFQWLTPLDLSTESSQNQVVPLLIEKARAKLFEVINGTLNQTINLEDYSFVRNPRSQLTNIAGIYLIVSPLTQKFYIGSASNLAQRKGDHKRNYTNDSRRDPIMRPFRATNIENIYFVPILTLPINLVNGLNFDSQTLGTFNQQLQRFFDRKVESVLINEVLTDSYYVRFITNTRDVGAFQPQNTFGGTPQSGQQDKPVAYRNLYAWESISAAAECLGRDRKTIRNKQIQGILTYLTKEEYENFPGQKISNRDSFTIFQSRQEELYNLKQAISPRPNIRRGPTF